MNLDFIDFEKIFGGGQHRSFRPSVSARHFLQYKMSGILNSSRFKL